MGQFIDYGSQIQKTEINKFDCAVGVEVKAMLINYSKPYARNLAYDKKNKCSVECTEEVALKYGLIAKPRYYFLVAAFQQDMQGNILGDTLSEITYLSMSNAQYEHFISASNNLDKWNGFVTLKKVQKKDDEGKDLSYIDASPASSNAQGFIGLSKVLISRIAELVKDETMIKRKFQLVDLKTGYYEDEYIERINQNKQENNPKNEDNKPKELGGKTQAAQLPQAEPKAIGESSQDVITAQAEIVDVQPTDDLPF